MIRIVNWNGNDNVYRYYCEHRVRSRDTRDQHVQYRVLHQWDSRRDARLKPPIVLDRYGTVVPYPNAQRNGKKFAVGVFLSEAHLR